MIGVPIDGTISIYCDNEVVHKKTVFHQSTLKRSITQLCHRCREVVADNVFKVANKGTINYLADLFTKSTTGACRTCLLNTLRH